MNTRSYVTALVGLLMAVATWPAIAEKAQPTISSSGKDRATGDAVVAHESFPARRHWFGFAAHELNGDLSGKGYISHQAFVGYTMEIKREEYAEVVYVVIEGNEAWFAGPVLYDTDYPTPNHWLVLHIVDHGKPNQAQELLDYERIYSGGAAAARDMVDNKLNPTQYIGIIESGNVKIHSK